MPLINTHAQVFVWTNTFIFLEGIPRAGISGSCGHPMFKLLKKLSENWKNDFPKRLHQFTPSPAEYGRSNLSTSSPTLVIICLFNPSECEAVLIFCGFNFAQLLQMLSTSVRFDWAPALLCRNILSVCPCSNWIVFLFLNCKSFFLIYFRYDLKRYIKSDD